MTAGVLTIGYERRTLDEFVAVLQSFDVDVLVDVRLNAISRKPGFSKKKLAAGVEAAAIEYRHEPSRQSHRQSRRVPRG